MVLALPGNARPGPEHCPAYLSAKVAGVAAITTGDGVLINATEFRAFLCSHPATSVAKGLILLACRTSDEQLFSATVAYFSRDFGTDYLADWLIDEVEPILTPEEQNWVWGLMTPKE